jgi:hypothetical protein
MPNEGGFAGHPKKTHPRFLGTPVPPLQEPPASCRFAASVWGTSPLKTLDFPFRDAGLRAGEKILSENRSIALNLFLAGAD